MENFSTTQHSQLRESKMTQLCETFQGRAHWTWDILAKARAINSQIGEETITDLHCLEFKLRHPTEVYTRTFSKREEGENGADWEWWFTDKSKWLGFRIQAKIIDFETNSFRHLHYKNLYGYQVDKLLHRALTGTHKKIPLYCLYLQWPSINKLPYQTFDQLYTKTDFGCSIISAFSVRYLREIEKKNDIETLLPHLQPWKCLTCPHWEQAMSLPQQVLRAWRILIRNPEIILKVGLGKRVETTELKEFDEQCNTIKPTNEPPLYVQQILEGGFVEQPDNDLRTITIFSM